MFQRFQSIMRGKARQNRKAHIMAARKQREKERECLSYQALSLFPFIPSEPPDYGVVPLTFRAGLPSLVNPLWKLPYQHTKKRCVLLVS
jgi:hypothetical protein